MNAYFNELTTPGFNAWYIAAVVFVLIMVLLGVKRYRLTSNHRNPKIKVKKRLNDERFVGAIAGIFAVIIMIMIVNESYNWIIQWNDNNLGLNESPVWSLIFAPVEVAVLGFFYWGILLLAFNISSWARHGYLWQKKQDLLQEEEQRQAKVDYNIGQNEPRYARRYYR